MSKWRKVEGDVEIREGVRPPYYELRLRKTDGTVVKIIARKVDEFLSEKWNNVEKL